MTAARCREQSAMTMHRHHILGGREEVSERSWYASSRTRTTYDGCLKRARSPSLLMLFTKSDMIPSGWRLGLVRRSFELGANGERVAGA